MNYRSSLMLVFAVGAAGTIFFASLTVSLWFLVGALPDLTGATMYGRGAAITRIQEVSSAGVSAFSVEAQQAEPLFSRIVIRERGSASMLIGIPRLRAMFSADGVLQLAGWNTQRIGWILYASRDDSSPAELSIVNTFIRGYESVYTAIVRRSQPLFPLVIAELTSRSFGGGVLSDPFTVMAWQRGENIQLEVTRGDWDQPRVERLVTAPKAALSFAGMGSLVERLPFEYQQQLNVVLAEQFGFAHTKPDFVSWLQETDHTAVLHEQEEIAVRVAGGEIVREALVAEQAYLYPTRSAFRLPDGTIGYEVVPDPEAADIGVPVIGECVEAEGEAGAQYVLCNEGSESIVASSKEIAEKLQSVALDGDGWNLQFGAEYSELLPIQFNHIMASGDDAGATVLIEI